LAVLLNPIHGNYYPFNMWLGDAKGKIKGGNGLKWGCTEFKMIKRVRAPRITLTQRVAFAILCSLEVCTDPEYKRTAGAAAEAAKGVSEVAVWALEAAAWASVATVRVTARAAARAEALAAEAAAEAAALVAQKTKINLVHLATECLK